MSILIAIITIALSGPVEDTTQDGRINGSDVIGDGSPVVGMIVAGHVFGAL